MNLLFADDTSMHRNYFERNLKDAASRIGLEYQLVSVKENGQDLCQAFEESRSGAPIDIVFSDIRMPVMDGLSALVKIRSINPGQTIVMVSSENASVMKAINISQGLKENSKLEDAKKLELLKRISTRIESGVNEEGKISSMLEGCEKLAADPAWVAREFGARGYLQKPYDVDKLVRVFEALKTESGFFVVD